MKIPLLTNERKTLAVMTAKVWNMQEDKLPRKEPHEFLITPEGLIEFKTEMIKIAIATKTRCKNCGSDLVRFDEEFGFYKCEICSLVWAFDEDDPDYDEVEEKPPDEPT